MSASAENSHARNTYWTSGARIAMKHAARWRPTRLSTRHPTQTAMSSACEPAGSHWLGGRAMQKATVHAIDTHIASTTKWLVPMM